MKTLVKSFFMALVAATATSAIAGYGPDNKVVKFAAENETYADGTKVLANEWLALCWSPDETLSPLMTDCTFAEDSGDQLIRVVSWAEEGRCPPIVFVLDGSDVKDTGYYFVVRLDTRVSATEVAPKGEDGLPAFVNQTIKENYSADAAVGTYVGSLISVNAAGNEYNALEDTVATPASLQILTTGRNAMVTAINLNPLVSYCIKSGKTLSLENAPTPIPKEVYDRTATVTFSFDDANFFKLDVAE